MTCFKPWVGNVKLGLITKKFTVINPKFFNAFYSLFSLLSPIFFFFLLFSFLLCSALSLSISSQSCCKQPQYGQQPEEKTKSKFGGMGTGLAVGAVAGVLGGLAIAEGVDYVEDKITGLRFAIMVV